MYNKSKQKKITEVALSNENLQLSQNCPNLQSNFVIQQSVEFFITLFCVLGVVLQTILDVYIYINSTLSECCPVLESGIFRK
jgi:hypothetical protein